MPGECVNNKGAWGGSNSSLHGQEVEEEVARVSESLQVHNSQWPKDLLPLGSTSQIVTGGTELLTCVPWGTSSIQIIASAIRKNKTRKWYIPDDKTKNASCHVKSNFESPGNCHGGCDDSMSLLQAANAVKVGMLQHRWTGWLRGGDATPRAVITPTLIRNLPLPLLSLQRGFENWFLPIWKPFGDSHEERAM